MDEVFLQLNQQGEALGDEYGDDFTISESGNASFKKVTVGESLILNNAIRVMNGSEIGLSLSNTGFVLSDKDLQLSSTKLNGIIKFNDPSQLMNMTTAQRDAIPSPVEGLTIFNSTTNELNYYDGTTWQSTGGSGNVSASLNFGTDNRIVRSDGINKDIQASGVTIDDSNNISGVGTLTATNLAGTITTASQPNITSVNDFSFLLDTMVCNAHSHSIQFDGTSAILNTRFDAPSIQINNGTALNNFKRSTWVVSESSSENLTGVRTHSDNIYYRIGNLVIVMGKIANWDSSAASPTPSAPSFGKLLITGLPHTITGSLHGSCCWEHPVSDEVTIIGSVHNTSSTTVKIVLVQYWSSAAGNLYYNFCYETS